MEPLSARSRMTDDDTKQDEYLSCNCLIFAYRTLSAQMLLKQEERAMTVSTST